MLLEGHGLVEGEPPGRGPAQRAPGGPARPAPAPGRRRASGRRCPCRSGRRAGPRRPARRRAARARRRSSAWTTHPARRALHLLAGAGRLVEALRPPTRTAEYMGGIWSSSPTKAGQRRARRRLGRGPTGRPVDHLPLGVLGVGGGAEGHGGLVGLVAVGQPVLELHRVLQADRQHAGGGGVERAGVARLARRRARAAPAATTSKRGGAGRLVDDEDAGERGAQGSRPSSRARRPLPRSVPRPAVASWRRCCASCPPRAGAGRCGRRAPPTRRRRSAGAACSGARGPGHLPLQERGGGASAPPASFLRTASSRGRET